MGQNYVNPPRVDGVLQERVTVHSVVGLSKCTIVFAPVLYIYE